MDNLSEIAAENGMVEAEQEANDDTLTICELNEDQYNEFFRVISILKESCEDLDIIGGVVRQRSTDNSSIFEIDLRSYLEDINLPLSKLKQKIELLKMFTGNEVKISVDEETCTFSDDYSTLSFKKVLPDYLDNRFMSEEDLNAIFNLNEDSLLLSTEVPTRISERINAIKQGFSITAIQINFEEETANMTAVTQSKDQHAKLMSDLITEASLIGTTDLLITPFIIDHDGDMSFKMYNIAEGVLVNKVDTTIGNIDVVIYGKSRLIQDETE